MNDTLSPVRVVLGHSVIGFAKNVMEIYLPKNWKQMMMKSCLGAKISHVQTIKSMLRIVGPSSKNESSVRTVRDSPSSMKTMNVVTIFAEHA